MAPNPDKQRCVATRPGGRPCARWATRGTAPPLSDAHGPGARRGMVAAAAGRRCTATTITGEPCLQWSFPGTDPPLCWIHAYPDEHPSRRRRYYPPVPAYSPAERQMIAAFMAEGRPIEAAIYVTRLRIRALLQEQKESDRPLAHRLENFTLFFKSVKTVQKLVVAQRALQSVAKPGQAVAQELDRLTAALAEL